MAATPQKRALTGRRIRMPDPTTLDATGLRCPLPVLRAKKALGTLAPGAALRVRATDPAAVKDFQAFCRETGNGFVGWARDGETYVIDITKAM
jgi:tRNA 2-thiouridine synthesizing protein A